MSTMSGNDDKMENCVCKWNSWMFSSTLFLCGVVFVMSVLLIYFIRKSRLLSKMRQLGYELGNVCVQTTTAAEKGKVEAKDNIGSPIVAKPPDKEHEPTPPAVPAAAAKAQDAKRPTIRSEKKISVKEGADAKKDGIKEKDKFQAPATGDKPDMADAKDPNYRSLKGLGNDVFEKKGDEKAEDKNKPKENQYETLDNIEKAGEPEEAKKPKFRPPDKIEKVGAKNPQYETLAGLDDQLFKKKEPAKPEPAAGKEGGGGEEEGDEGKPKKVAFKRPEMGKVSAKNPQYETFADVADDIFKGKKKE